MTKTEIVRIVKEVTENGRTVIITPKAMSSVFSQLAIENVPGIQAEESINGQLYGMSVKSKDGKYSDIRILGY